MTVEVEQSARPVPSRWPSAHPGMHVTLHYPPGVLSALCTVTGCSEVYRLRADYLVGSWVVEARSFGRYLASFAARAVGTEDLCGEIVRMLSTTVVPVALRVRITKQVADGEDRYRLAATQYDGPRDVWRDLR